MTQRPPGRGLIRLLIVDDHPVLREGLRGVLHGRGIVVAGEAGTGQEAVQRAVELCPDVVLMDINMPGMDGIAATREIKAALPTTAVLVFTSFDSPQTLRAALLAGAAGYLVKGAPPQVLREAVATVRSGGSVVDGALLHALLVPEPPQDAQAAELVAGLTPRERQALQFIMAGLSNAEIAEAVHYSTGTVKNTVQRIIEKLGVSDRAQAAVLAVRAGLPPPPPPSPSP